MDMVTITILIAIIGCIIGIANWVRNVCRDSDQLTEYIIRLETRLNHLEEQICELKSDVKQMQQQTQTMFEDLITTKNRTKALHSRLDTVEAKSSLQIKK